MTPAGLETRYDKLGVPLGKNAMNSQSLVGVEQQYNG